MAQKTIDFEKDILEPIDTLKQGLSAESDARKKDVQTLDDNKITKFYTSNQGQKVLNDSDDGKIQDLMIYGKSEQKQYKGKNLLNILKRNTTLNGIVYTVNDDGTVILNGTASDVVDIVVSSSFYIEKGKAYRMTGWVKGQAGILYMLNLNEAVSDNGDGITFVYNGDTTDAKVIHVQCQKNTVFHNVVIKPMIVDASIYPDTTYNDYEPYTGGKPSPSPEYPQEIKAVVNPTVKTHGKNLIDTRKSNSGVAAGITWTVNPDGSIKRKGTATASVGNKWFLGDYHVNPYEKPDEVIVTLKAGKTYYVRNCTLFSMSENNTERTLYYGVNKLTADFLVTGVRDGGLTNGKVYDDTIYPMITEANEAVDWQPYQETQATLPYELHAIPVESGGNVTIGNQQYIADYVDIEKGVLVRNVKVLDVNSTEWVLNEETVGNVRTRVILNTFNGTLATRTKRILSNKFENLYNREGFDRSWSNKIYNIANGQIVLLLTYGTEVTEEKWKKIKENLSIIYVADTAEVIDLTQDQIEAFKALSTYYPKTYITAESEQLEAYTMFNYPVSMEKGWEYVKQQIGDTRKYVYDMETKLSDAEYDTAMAYVNSEYAVALTELGM